jgi:hypothetical protein
LFISYTNKQSIDDYGDVGFGRFSLNSKSRSACCSEGTPLIILTLYFHRLIALKAALSKMSFGVESTVCRQNILDY